MADYSRKRCVVCSQVGGIDPKEDGLYVCRHCGTPYRPRAAKPSPTAGAEPADASTKTDRFIWFSYTDNGQPRSGFYDYPLLPDAVRPTLTVDRTKLRFLKYLVEKGHLVGDSAVDADHLGIGCGPVPDPETPE